MTYALIQHSLLEGLSADLSDLDLISIVISDLEQLDGSVRGSFGFGVVFGGGFGDVVG